MVKEEIKGSRHWEQEGIGWKRGTTYLVFFMKKAALSIEETTKANFERHGITAVLDMKMISAATISAIKGDTDFRVSEQAIKSGQQQQKSTRWECFIACPYGSQARNESLPVAIWE
jgi:hypothetical protein